MASPGEAEQWSSKGQKCGLSPQSSRKRVEEVCFRSLALIGRNCEYLEQHFDRTGADESTRQAVADINAAAVQLDRTLSEAMTLLEFLREEAKAAAVPR